MEIIPAIDIIDGKCVRLTKGDYSTAKQYSDDPVRIAKDFEEAGIRRLHVVDLDGAKASHVVNVHVLNKICKDTSLQVDFGGGVKTDDDLQKVFDAGAEQITAGSIAVKDREQVMRWISDHGNGRIIIGADVLNENVMIAGWQESSELNLFDFLEQYIHAGIKYVICTDISKDGVLQGPSFSLYKKILEQFPDLHLIASGGVSSLEDIHQLKANKLYGAIIGKAFYEGKLSLEDLSNANA